jgi:hypothetical protein
MRPAALAALAIVAVVVVACSSGGAASSPPASGSPSTPPSSSPSPTSAIGAIEHKTGATDVVLRYEQSGGMIRGFAATQVPIFTLYGDGTIIFRNPDQDPLEPVGNVYPARPFRVAKLDEGQIQALLSSAIGEGGLGAARAKYDFMTVSDAPTTVFTLSAGGMTKTVSVYALGFEPQPGDPDALAKVAFATFAQRLADFDQGGTIATQEYVPERYRGVLLESGPGDPAAQKWPWDDVKPADFVAPGDPNLADIPVKALTIAQVEALGVAPYQGGFQGPTLIGPDNKFYSFALRPLLPDDAS